MSFTNGDMILSRVDDKFTPVVLPVSEDEAVEWLGRVFDDPLFDSTVVADNMIKVFWSNPHNDRLVITVCEFMVGDIGEIDPIEHLYHLASTTPHHLMILLNHPEMLTL